jgi:hypothetical protein
MLCGINPDKALNQVYNGNSPYNAPLPHLKPPVSAASRFFYGKIPHNILLEMIIRNHCNGFADRTAAQKQQLLEQVRVHSHVTGF